MPIFHDRAEIKNGTGTITAEGYFVADALVARADNVQDYRASELGLTDRPAGEIVRVFRPASEVFAVDSLATAAHIPITLDHPPVMVDAGNVLQYRRGGTGGEVLRDGQFMRIPLRIEDEAAVTSVRTERKEFSLGYGADLKLEAGVFDGQAYDASVTNIRYNHLAACRTARGGPELRIIDSRPDARQPEGNPMPHIVMVDSLPVDVALPETAAQVIKQVVLARDTATTALADMQGVLTTANNLVATRDGEIVALKDSLEKAKLSPQMLRDAAGDYARVSASAKALGATITDAMDAQQIRDAAVAHKLPGKVYATDAERNAVFDVLAASVKPADVKDAAGDPLRAMLGDGVPVNLGDAETAAAKARAVRFARFGDAHLGANAGAAN